MTIQLIEPNSGAEFSELVQWKRCMSVATIARELEQYTANDTMSAILFAIAFFGWQGDLLPFLLTTGLSSPHCSFLSGQDRGFGGQ